MSNPVRTEVKLTIRRDDGGAPAVETLDVVQLESNLYRLVYSPGLVEGLAAGDEFEVLPNEPAGFRVVKRSGNLCVWFAFETEGQNRGPDGDRVKAAVEALGGVCDGGGHYHLVFTIPLSVGFSAIQAVYDDLVRRYPGSCWWYGNVYDPADGKTPLRWWERPAEFGDSARQ